MQRSHGSIRHVTEEYEFGQSPSGDLFLAVLRRSIDWLHREHDDTVLEESHRRHEERHKFNRFTRGHRRSTGPNHQRASAMSTTIWTAIGSVHIGDLREQSNVVRRELLQGITLLQKARGDRKSTRLNSSHSTLSRMPSSA